MGVDDELSTPILHSDDEERNHRTFNDDELNRETGCTACCNPSSGCHRFIAMILMCLVGFGNVLFYFCFISLLDFLLMFRYSFISFLFLLWQSWSSAKLLYERHGYVHNTVRMAVFDLFVAQRCALLYRWLFNGSVSEFFFFNNSNHLASHFFFYFAVCLAFDSEPFCTCSF